MINTKDILKINLLISLTVGVFDLRTPQLRKKISFQKLIQGSQLADGISLTELDVWFWY